jgi:hypothetical protein
MNRHGQRYGHVPVESVKRASERPLACCIECRHFVLHFVERADEAEKWTEPFLVHGHCRRHPPVGLEETVWPVTKGHHFCGEHSPIVEDRLPYAVRGTPRRQAKKSIKA